MSIHDHTPYSCISRWIRLLHTFDCSFCMLQNCKIHNVLLHVWICSFFHHIFGTRLLLTFYLSNLINIIDLVYELYNEVFCKKSQSIFYFENKSSGGVFAGGSLRGGLCGGSLRGVFAGGLCGGLCGGVFAGVLY